MSSTHDSYLETLPEGWGNNRMGNVDDILFSNVDKHTFESETPVRLCNYVGVYKNDRITSEIEFMEASTVAWIAEGVGSKPRIFEPDFCHLL